MTSFAFLLDAPSGTPRGRIQIAKLGSFTDPRYGDFEITADMVRSWARNLARLPGGRVAIDEDHAADKAGAARRTEASGWITGISLEDGVPMADVEWTPKGESAIRDKRYLFFSPTFGPWVDEHGTRYPDTLIGGALTNRPFLGLPTISLSAAAPTELHRPKDATMPMTLDQAARAFEVAQSEFSAATGRGGDITAVVGRFNDALERYTTMLRDGRKELASPAGRPTVLDQTLRTLLDDHVTLDRVVRAIQMETGWDYLKALDGLDNAGGLLGYDCPLAKVLDGSGIRSDRVEAEIRKMERSVEEAKTLAREAAAAGPSLNQVGQVQVTLDRAAEKLASATDLERDWLLARRCGVEDRVQFEQHRRISLESGVDYVATLMHESGIPLSPAQAQARAKARSLEAEQAAYERREAERRPKIYALDQELNDTIDRRRRLP